MRRAILLIFIAIAGFIVGSDQAWCGSISGTVTDGQTSAAVAGIHIDIYDSNWHYTHFFQPTDDQGGYQISGLPAGGYFIKANPIYPQHYRWEYWHTSFTMASATMITLEADQDLSGVNFVLVPGGFIGGVVRDVDTAAPIADLQVQVYDFAWHELEDSGKTDGQGIYTNGGLPTGNYYVKANPFYPEPHVDQYWDHTKGPTHAAAVAITAPGDVLIVNFDLSAGGYITGTVRDAATQTWIQNIKIVAYNQSWSKMRIEDHTNDQGVFVLGAWEAGNYFIQAEPEYPAAYRDEYYNGSYTQEDAIAATIEPPSDTTGIDFDLDPGAYLLGSVTNQQTGQPLAGIELAVFDGSWQSYPKTATTDYLGQFFLGSLPSGTYYLTAPIDDAYYYREFWQEASDQSQATPITLNAPQSAAGLTFTLEPKSVDVRPEFVMPSQLFHPNDQFYLNLQVTNNAQDFENIPLFVVLSVADVYYFWPDWVLYNPPYSTDIDFKRTNVPQGISTVTIIESVAWPQTGDSLNGIIFLGAFMNEGLNAIVGDVASIEWGYAQ